MEARKLDKISVAEYLEIERSTQTKHEYHDGLIYAMSGGTLEHGLICGNTYGEIRNALRNQSNECIPINSEVKLHLVKANKYVYPDVMVVCGPIEKAKEEPNAITNPKVIIEVLSKTTESYDRGDKFHNYRQITTLEEYILIDQYKAQVEIYTRKSDLWRITLIKGLDQELILESLNIVIPLEYIYENINWKKP
jgi:Uma2 family endonuclease